MAYVCIIISSPNDSIANLNDRCQTPTKVHEEIVLLQNFLARAENGQPAVIQVVTRDTDPGVTASGSGSLDKTYSKL